MAKTYKIEPVAIPGDIEDVLRFMNSSFCIEEPMNAAVGLTEDGPCHELDDYCKEALLEGLSYKAVDGDGNIIGVTISGESSLESKAEALLAYAENCTNPKFQKIVYVLAKREEGAKLQEKFPQHQKLVEVKFASTDPAWRQQGIMNELMKTTEKACLAKGITLVRIDTSSLYSRKSAERLGFTCVYKEKYTDIKKDGVPIVVPAMPHEYDCVYIKQL